jgi:uncharacterized protein YkwD
MLGLPLLNQKLESVRSRLFQALQERRTTALALIHDDKEYPYPYGPNGEEVQGRVDGLVARVVQVWESPSEQLIEWDESFANLHGQWKETEVLMGSAGVEESARISPIAEVHKRLAMKRYAPDSRLMTQKERDVQVAQHNERMVAEGVVTAEELDCYVATNEYREMMGLPAVMAEETIVKCARGHSEEMQRLGYFAHDSPVEGRKSPGDRARLAGWGGGVSENIARGQPTGRAAVHSWVHSSGHHRNILGTKWTHLGVGKSPEGFFWTQNFSKAATKVPQKPAGG